MVRKAKERREARALPYPTLPYPTLPYTGSLARALSTL